MKLLNFAFYAILKVYTRKSSTIDFSTLNAVNAILTTAIILFFYNVYAILNYYLNGKIYTIPLLLVIPFFLFIQGFILLYYYRDKRFLIIFNQLDNERIKNKNLRIILVYCWIALSVLLMPIFSFFKKHIL